MDELSISSGTPGFSPDIEKPSRDVKAKPSWVAEAEQTLRAIPEGETDALVVQGDVTDKLYALKSFVEMERADAELKSERSERRRSDAARRESERRFETLATHAPVGIFMNDAAGNCTFVNPRCCEIMQMSPENAVMQGWADALHPEDRDRVLSQWDEALRSTGFFESEYRFRWPNGKSVWVAGKAVALRDENASPYGYLGTVQDITERKRAQQLEAGQHHILELLATGRPLTELLEALCCVVEEQVPGMLISILVLDEDGRRLRHGAAMNLPQPYVRAVDGLEIGPCAGSCGTAAYRGETVIIDDIESDPLCVNFRELARVHDLRACWSVPIRNGGHQVLGTFAMYYRQPKRPSDEEMRLITSAAHLAGITIRHTQAELAIKAAHHKMKTVLNASPVAILSIDPAGRIMAWNQGAERMFGWSEQEVIGHVCPTVPDEGLDDFHDMIGFVLSGAPWAGKVRGRRKNSGEVIRACISAAPLLDASGEKIGIVAILDDVTERERVNERLRALVEERERFVQDLHDGCIQSIYAIGLNLEECRQMIREDPRTAAGKIADAAADLNLVIQDLRLSIPGDERELAEGHDLKLVLEKVIQMLADRPPAFVIDIDEAVADSLTPAQAAQLVQIVREGISNAVRHAKARSGRVSLQIREGAVCLEVSDDGIGFDPEVLEKQGLGLHHIDARARKLGGRSRVVSAPNQGTRVVVEIPSRR